MKRLLRFIALSALIALPVACGSRDGGRDQHVARGDEYASQKRFSDAVIEYKSAIQADPMFAPARQKLARVYLQAGDTTRAVDELVRVADLIPGDFSAQLEAARVLIATGRFDDARGRAEKALAIDPNNVEAQILRANALGGLQDFDAALSQIESALQTDPANAVVLANLGALRQAGGNVAEAEAAFKKAVYTNPNSIEFKLALANLYWTTGRHKEAESALIDALKLQPQHLQANRAIAMLYIGSDRARLAEAPLKILADGSPTAMGRMLLADYYAWTGRSSEAKATYQSIVDDPILGSAAKIRLASLGLAQGDRSGAAALVDSVLNREPQNYEALVGRAQLRFAEGKQAEALDAARRAVAANDGAPNAYYVLGRILAAQGQNEDATNAFKDALRVNPQYVPAAVELARLALAAGNTREAIQFAQNVLQISPNHGEALLLQARAQLMAGDPKSAERQLAKIAGTGSPSVQAELGLLFYQRGDLAGSRAAFDKAIAGDKTNPTALEGLIMLDVRQQKPEVARKRLESLLAQSPDSATVQVVGARIYATAFNDLSAAEKAAQRALAADPDNLAGYDLLARIYAQTGRLAEATKQFETLATKQPKSVANLTAVAILQGMQGRPDEARATYEKVLALDPKAPIAANNLAQYYSDRNENLDTALQLAQTAKAGLPKSHEIDDTLGWLHYKKGQAVLAISSLQAAVTARPDNASYLYHLGAAYALNKDTAKARLALEKALKIGKFEGADDARKILDSLK